MVFASYKTTIIVIGEDESLMSFSAAANADMETMNARFSFGIVVKVDGVISELNGDFRN